MIPWLEKGSENSSSLSKDTDSVKLHSYLDLLPQHPVFFPFALDSLMVAETPEIV